MPSIESSRWPGREMGSTSPEVVLRELADALRLDERAAPWRIASAAQAGYLRKILDDAMGSGTTVRTLVDDATGLKRCARYSSPGWGPPRFAPSRG